MATLDHDIASNIEELSSELSLVSSEDEKNEGFSSCSNELLLFIFSFVDAKDLCRIAQVCSLWNQLSEDQILWRNLCIKSTFPNLSDSSQRWKSVYRWYHECRTHTFSENELRNGRGNYTWKNGCRYEGEWLGGKEHGKGSKVWVDGTTYSGNWKEGLFHGIGKHLWASGSIYEGEWNEHKRNGIGKNTWSQRDTYEGGWKNDQKHGFGIYLWCDKRRYSGMWNEDERCGFGVFHWPTTSCRYEGEWLHNNRHGFGKFYWGDGSIFEGEWINGKRCGRGRLIMEDKVFIQNWNEEEFDAANKGDTSKEYSISEVPSQKETKRKASTENIEDVKTSKRYKS